MGRNQQTTLKSWKGSLIKHKAVLVVGHSPSVEKVEVLTGSQDVIMPTCALCSHISTDTKLG